MLEPPPGRTVPLPSQQPPCDVRAVNDGLGDRGRAARGAPERLGLLKACGDCRRAAFKLFKKKKISGVVWWLREWGKIFGYGDLELGFLGICDVGNGKG